MSGRFFRVEVTKSFEIVSGMAIDTFLGDAPITIHVLEVWGDRIVYERLGKRVDVSPLDFAEQIADEVLGDRKVWIEA